MVLKSANGVGRHINADATFRTKCGRPHLVREIRTLRSMSGDGKRGVAAWPRLPRRSSTLQLQSYGNVLPTPALPLNTRHNFGWLDTVCARDSDGGDGGVVAELRCSASLSVW